MKQKISILILFLILISSVSAINLEIEEEKVNDVIIIELDNSAYFTLSITNLEESDDFELYSLVGVDIFPKEAFNIEFNETKNITVEIKALESAKRNLGYYTFVYKIKGSTGIQEDKLTIKIVDLKEAIALMADNIKPDDKIATVHLQNKEEFDFSNIEAEFSSVFFQFKEKNFSLSSLGKKSFTTSLAKEKLESLVAGPFILNANIKIDGSEADLESTVNFLEKSGISTEETKEGTLIVRYEIKKKNEGNLITIAEAKLEKNMISRLFTTFNLSPTQVERQGSTILYTWRQELRPGETLTVIAKTNWMIPIIIITVIVIIILLFRIYFMSDIILKKKINLVKTKGGEFALKVSLHVKARRFVERINIIDKLPPIVKLYERYGTIAPDRIDEKNRRVEWSLESLNENEETVLSYIVYSKIGVVGKFELPSAKAIYERDGKIKETFSNKVYFVSEPRNKED